MGKALSKAMRQAINAATIVIDTPIGSAYQNANASKGRQEVLHYQHRIKCLECGLHFVVCSEFKQWPREGTTLQQKSPSSQEAAEQGMNGHAFCPECGKQGRQVHWQSEETRFIYEVVPGEAELVGIKAAAKRLDASEVASVSAHTGNWSGENVSEKLQEAVVGEAS